MIVVEADDLGGRPVVRGSCPNVHAIRIEPEIRWQLPQDRTQLLIEGEHARGKKFASGVSMAPSFFMCVMKRPPFTAKTKSSGTEAARSRSWTGAAGSRSCR